MAIKNLHDFPALQVPQIYFAVFATRHDPLAAGDAEAGGDTILGVLVANVRLQAARRLEVPQPNSAVVGGGEYVFRVGRKLHVLAATRERKVQFLKVSLVPARVARVDGALENVSYQIALCPSARVLRHCPDGKVHMRLRGWGHTEGARA